MDDGRDLSVLLSVFGMPEEGKDASGQ